MVKYVLRNKVIRRICTLRRCILRIWDRILMCSLGKPMYHMLPAPVLTSPVSPQDAGDGRLESGEFAPDKVPPRDQLHYHYEEADLVALKISLLGDCQIGKTSFLEKYVGNEKEDHGVTQENGLNFMGKTLMIGGARISYSLWEVDGSEGNRNIVSKACKDSVAILIMFDLTSRITLNGVIDWYKEARKWNQTAIPIIVGTKFDDFIQLPIDLQWAIASQARSYAKALKAPLFFSSATYNINVNKIFKFITAKIFDVPWQLERNLNVGEPIIDF